VITFNIAIIDADLIGRKKHRFPNLVCMKLSGYYKEQGHNVNLITDYKNLYIQENIWTEYQNAISKYANNQNGETQNLLGEKMIPCFQKSNFKYDKIFISKVFTDTQIDEDFLQLDFVEYGGTGFFYDKAEPLPDYIEHHKPDYHLYNDWVKEQIENGCKKLEFKYYTDYSIGFTTRGCFRQCQFCVNKNYKSVKLHSPVEEFIDVDRKYICLLDDNILGFGKWKSIVEKLQATGKSFEFKQGMDLRLMTKEKAEVLSKSKYIGDYIFAFDNIEDREAIENKLRLWRSYCSKTSKFYVFCGFDRSDKWDYDFWVNDIQDTFERIKILMQFGCLPYIMRFNRYDESPYRGTYINLARWCNQPNFYKKKSYREFCIANGENSSTVKYMKQIEADHPEIAQEYFDLRFDVLNKYN
jgi:hypothetical protein